MKKLLVALWNKFFDLIIKLKEAYWRIFDFFYRNLTTPPNVMTNSDTIDYIIKNCCSVSRCGDGEIRLAAGIDISFQHAVQPLVSKLRKVLSCDEKQLLVCLPDAFGELDHFVDRDGQYWKKHLAKYRRRWYKYTRKDKIYGNAFISRVYMCFNEKDKARAYFDSLKKIWDGEDIVIVEGEKSRLGIGNDLFDNARTIRRILGPIAQAFSQYDNLLKEIRKTEKSSLIILALGPAATIMPYDLLDDGYRAVDLGNIDTEYEWFLRGCTRKTPIKNKLVYEAGAGKGVGELNDEVYQSQIIAKIT